jgi:hypothetical protein
MWQDWIIQQAIGTILLLIQTMDEAQKKKWKKALLKVARAIIAAFPDEGMTLDVKP